MSGRPVLRWHMAPEGERIAASIGAEDDQLASMRLVFLLNFTDELQRKSK